MFDRAGDMGITWFRCMRLVLCILSGRLERKCDVVISVVARIEKSRNDVMYLQLIWHGGLSGAAREACMQTGRSGIRPKECMPQRLAADYMERVALWKARVAMRWHIWK